MNFRKPMRLRPGDTIAVVSPSAGLPNLFPWVYEQGLQRIEDIFKLKVIEFPTARQSPEFLSENPKARADDINAAFSDPLINGVIATIGGNDQVRILPYLDAQLIARNPKIFMGYSDCTNLHLFLWNLGIISYYGGAVMTQFAMGGGMHPYTVESIDKALFCAAIGKIEAAKEWSDVDLDWGDKENLLRKRPYEKGEGWHWVNCPEHVIEGTLWGGCLEVLELQLSIQKYLPPFEKLEGAVLFIETSEELPTEGFVYRFIAALGELGLLNKFKAILMGIPKTQFCGKMPPEGREIYRENQQKAVLAALKDYRAELPVIFGMNFGHTDPQLILPNGGTVRIDGISKTISFL